MSFPIYIRNKWQGNAVLLVLLLAGILAVPAPAGAARPQRCKVSGAETLLVTRDARIFKTTIRRPSGAWTETVSGCVKRTGERFMLSRLDFDGVYKIGASAAYFKRVGRRVAFVVQWVDDRKLAQQDFGVRAPSLQIVGLREGSLLRDYRLSDNVIVTDFEARPGAMAWIEHDAAGSASRVHQYAARSETRLDAGHSIDLESLTARNGSFFWTNGGERRSAAFRTVQVPEARCRPPGSTALITTKEVRIFRITLIRRRPDRTRTSVYHCVRRTGKRVELSRLTRDEGNVLGAEALFLRRVGARLAYVLNRIDGYASKYHNAVRGPSLRIVGLRSGRLLADLQLADDTQVRDFEARPGAMAWIEGSSYFPPYRWSVRVYVANTLKVLDSGESIDPESLSTDGASIFWTNGGESRSAPFG